MQGKQSEICHVRDILRLRAEGASDQLAACCVALASSTVRATCERAAAAGLAGPLDEGLGDKALAALLYTQHGKAKARCGHRWAEPE